MRSPVFSDSEKQYYLRHLSLEAIGDVGQMRLKKASVLVIGAGGLGCPVLQYLVAAGIGKIGIVDSDRVEISNLQRQVLFFPEDTGELKASVAQKRLSKYNPHITIEAFAERLSPGNVKQIFNSFEIIVDGSDNFPTRYLVNDACVLMNKVLVHGSIFQFHGQVSVFNFNKGPTYRCLFPEPPTKNTLPSCSEAGVLGVLPGIIGTIQATETIKLITGVGETLSGKLLLYDALSQETNIVTLEANCENQNIKELPEMNESCSSQKQHSKGMNEINPLQLKELMEKDKHLAIIDVRESWEREIDSIEPSSHIPLNEFSNPDTLVIPKEVEKNSKIVLFCKAGVRSKLACEVLFSLGYSNLLNLKGGITNWNQEFPRF
tara:strand:+ start:3161 stop:4288 length:1128 start_codon:yes stop_codon:yes gene_type:complete